MLVTDLLRLQHIRVQKCDASSPFAPPPPVGHADWQKREGIKYLTPCLNLRIETYSVRHMFITLSSSVPIWAHSDMSWWCSTMHFSGPFQAPAPIASRRQQPEMHLSSLRKSSRLRLGLSVISSCTACCAISGECAAWGLAQTSCASLPPAGAGPSRRSPLGSSGASEVFYCQHHT
jgi:hypothetical protein